MTVSTEISRNTHAGNGSTTSFAFGFKIFNEEDLTVTYFGPSYPSAGTVQVLNTEYTVDNFGESGGQITLATTLTSDDTVEIKRDIAYTQDVDFVQNSAFDAAVMEDLADRLAMLSQQAKAEADSAVKISGAAEEDTEYLIPPPEDGKFPVGNTSGGWDNKEIGDLSATSITVPVAVAEGGTGGTTAALARTNLGLGSVAVLDTGTAAGEVPKNSDLGSSAVIDAGTGADEVLQIDSSGRLPVISGRNLTESRAFVELVDQTVGTDASYAFTALDEYDNYLIELDQIGNGTTQNEMYLELYIDSTLIGVGGTTGQYNAYFAAARTGAESGFNFASSDSIQLTPSNFLGATSEDSGFCAQIHVRNNYRVFSASGTFRDEPSISWAGHGHFQAGENRFIIYNASANCMTAGASIDGFKLRSENNFDGGLIRIFGYNGPMVI